MTLQIDDEATVWSAPANERAGKHLLVLLHGYGSNEGDLIGLVPALPEGIVFASLRAPLVAQWPVDGYAWFPLDIPGAPGVAETEAAADAIIAWLDRIDADQQFESIGLLGFSQGGAAALQLLRHAPTRFRYAVNLAGFIAPGSHAGDAALSVGKPPVFWGRGSADRVIDDAAIVRTTDWLPSHSTLSGRIYDGLAHQIAADEIADVASFIDAQLTP